MNDKGTEWGSGLGSGLEDGQTGGCFPNSLFYEKWTRRGRVVAPQGKNLATDYFNGLEISMQTLCEKFHLSA